MGIQSQLLWFPVTDFADSFLRDPDQWPGQGRIQVQHHLIFYLCGLRISYPAQDLTS